MDIKRNIIAIVLIGVVLLLTPMYYKLITPERPDIPFSEETFQEMDTLGRDLRDISEASEPVLNQAPEPIAVQSDIEEKEIIINTDLYRAAVNSRSGGTLTSLELAGYSDGFTKQGDYVEDASVQLLPDDDDFCRPCLGYWDRDEKEYQLINIPFKLENAILDSVYIDGSEVQELHFVSPPIHGGVIRKTMTLHGDSYTFDHSFTFEGMEELYRTNLELLWLGGMLPTEYVEAEDNFNAAALVYQGGTLDDQKMKKADKPLLRKQLEGNTEWVAVKNKYFLAALIPEKSAGYAAVSAKNTVFDERDLTPLYNVALGFDANIKDLSAELYLGPQDYGILKNMGHDLDNAMNWGFTWIRPISKYIIYTTLKFLRNPFGNFYINYGIVLILFAFIVRAITGPLMKKSYASNKKMQAIQPKVAKLKEKYKDDPTRLNKETMALYKSENVNMFGGCLPTLIQMPLLFALFVVFRNTIEFRGAEFFLWISDLSKPDVIFTLPFSIPFYGSGVAVLPIFMATTMFFQMRMTSSTMEGQQKMMMYFMPVFLFFVFNQFPSGLNLYYAVTNLLGIIQQRNINKNLKI